MPGEPLVVLIEDQEALVSVLKEVFVREGYEVVSVADCAAAREVTGERQVDLVVLDGTALQEDQPVESMCDEYPDVAVIAVRNQEDLSIPIFGRWRRDGRVATLRRPFRLEDMVSAARELVATV